VYQSGSAGGQPYDSSTAMQQFYFDRDAAGPGVQRAGHEPRAQLGGEWRARPGDACRRPRLYERWRSTPEARTCTCSTSSLHHRHSRRPNQSMALT